MIAAVKIVRACLAVLLVACLGAPPSAGMQPTPGHTVGMPDANRVTRTADGSLGERWPAEPAMSDAMTAHGATLVRDGQPVGFGLAIGRQFLHILDSLPFYIGYLWPLWDERRQTFADKVADTVVVQAGR